MAQIQNMRLPCHPVPGILSALKIYTWNILTPVILVEDLYISFTWSLQGGGLMVSRSQAPTQGELIREEAAIVGPTGLDVEKTLKSLHGEWKQC